MPETPRIDATMLEHVKAAANVYKAELANRRLSQVTLKDYNAQISDFIDWLSGGPIRRGYPPTS